MRRRVVLTVVLLLSLLCATVTQASIDITTAVGNGADTFVGNDSNKGPNNNYGGGLYIDVRDYEDVRAHIGYVKFDISGAGGGDLTDAQLQLDLTDAQNTRDWNIYGLIDNAVDDAWGEMTITYNNAPGMVTTNPEANGSYIIDTTKLTLLGTMNVGAGTGLRTSNTADLNLDSFLGSDTDGLVTLVLIGPSDRSGRQYFFNSKEAAAANPLLAAPTLILPNAIPEPTTMFLLGFGSLWAVGKKRR